MSRTVLQLDPRDNLLVAVTDLRRGQVISFRGDSYTLVADVPMKHKFLTEAREPGDPVTMYGVIVGRATTPIPKGGVVSTRNLRHEASGFRSARGEYLWSPPDISVWRDLRFAGYHRADGQVGTRNNWLVIPLVFCENRNIAALQEAFEEELGYTTPGPYRQQVARLANLYREGATNFETAPSHEWTEREFMPLFKNVDGIRFLTHQGGCGGTREDARNLCSLIAGYIHNPNVAGATVLSLGCQNAEVAMLHREIQRRDPNFSKPLIVLDQQACGTQAALLSQAVQRTFRGLVDANSISRQPVSLSGLTLGLKCGGSDGFSGISANPAVGHVSDIVASLGGKTILAEFPELCGVEQQLVDRCSEQALADKFIELMRDYAERARAARTGFEMNPSPGNIQDGLITDAMKSAGAARKSGMSPIRGVLNYPEYAISPGLNLLCTPGNDVECVTAQAGAGANIVLFTTGLGTPTGNPIAPVVKISTNSARSARMPDLIDFDAGEIIAGRCTVQESGDAILRQVIEVASGRVKTKAETLRQFDFIPWKRGISL